MTRTKQTARRRRGGGETPTPTPSTTPFFPRYRSCFQNPSTLSQPQQPLGLAAYSSPLPHFSPFQYSTALLPDPSSRSPAFTHPSPRSDPREAIDRVEEAVAKAHQELLTAGDHVTSWKVSQAALVSLRVDSWGSLGVQMQDVPSLRRLMSTEGKMDAFIHCFVGSRKITSLHDLDTAICVAEGIECFEQLGLGPLLRHPLVMHYFLVPADASKVPKITTEEIISCLHAFVKAHNRITPEKVLGFLRQQHSIGPKEMIGVLIRDLWFYIACIRQAKKAELSTVQIVLGSSGYDPNTKPQEASSSPVYDPNTKPQEASSSPGYDPNMKPQEVSNSPGYDSNMKPQEASTPGYDHNIKLQEVKFRPPIVLEVELDKPFGLISGHMDLFSTDLKNHSTHNRSDSLGDNGDGNNKSVPAIESQNLSKRKDATPRVSSCPFSSTAEETVRLQMNSDVSRKRSFANDKMKTSDCIVHGGKKRKIDGPKNTVNFDLLHKFIRSVEGQSNVIELPSHWKNSFELDDAELKDFVTTWKRQCQQKSVFEVFNTMLNCYCKPKGGKKQAYRRLRPMLECFSSYPGVGLLNICVAAVKYGMFDTLYGTIESTGQNVGGTFETLGVGPGDRGHSIDKKNTEC